MNTKPGHSLLWWLGAAGLVALALLGLALALNAGPS